jgi:hypothetical protein
MRINGRCTSLFSFCKVNFGFEPILIVRQSVANGSVRKGTEIGIFVARADGQKSAEHGLLPIVRDFRRVREGNGP